MSLCRISFFTEPKELQIEALGTVLISLNVFCLKQALTRITDHCRAQLSSTMATVTAATGGRTEQHSTVADGGLTDSTGKVQPTGGKHTEGACAGL